MVLLVIVSIIWGSTFSLIKNVVVKMDESLIVLIRTSIAFVALLCYQAIKSPGQLLNKKAFAYGALLGFLIVSTFYSQTIGLKFTSAGHSAFITGSAVALVPGILFFFFKKKVNKVDIMVVITVIFGLFLLTYDRETSINKGDLITLITALSLALYTVLAGVFIRKTDPTTLITYQFFFASVISLIIWCFSEKSEPIFDQYSIFTLLYLGLIGTLLCYFITVWTQQKVDALKVSMILSTESISAAIFGYLIHAEVLNNQELLGSSIIVGAIILHSVIKKRLVSFSKA